MKRKLLFWSLLLAAGVALAEGPPADKPEPTKPAVEPAASPEAQPPATADPAPGAKEEPAPGAGDPAAGSPKQEDAGTAAGDTADDDEQPPVQTGPKMISGMSILGNQEAPTSLVIVPWKSSVIGDAIGISTMLDDSRQPVDREVFLRALSYYEIRSEREP